MYFNNQNSPNLQLISLFFEILSESYLFIHSLIHLFIYLYILGPISYYQFSIDYFYFTISMNDVEHCSNNVNVL